MVNNGDHDVAFVSYGSCVEHKSGQFLTELHKTLVCKNGVKTGPSRVMTLARGKRR